MPVCAGLVVWGMLDGATRGRCLIVLWGRGALSADWFWVHGSYGGRGLHAWLRPGRHLDLYIVFWTALHMVGVSLFCEAGERCVSGLAFGTRQLWWPWVACLAAAWEAFESVHYIFDFVCLQCMDIGIDGQWYGVRHFGFRGPVSLGAWSTWRGPWAAGTGRSGEWMPAVLMFTYGNLMHVGHRSAVLCLLLTLLGFVLTLHRTGNDFINLTGNSDFVLVNMSEELSRSRAACRGWVTRECKNLATTLEDPELNVVKLSAAMDEFDKRLTNLDDVQSRYELSLENEDAILNDITTAADFRDSARKVRTLATEKFKELSGDSDNKSAAHVSSFSMTDVKLPKLNLPVFNGDVLQWQSFWDQFVAAVDSTDFPDVSKFSYLRASLEGEPKAAIQGLSLTSAHYASACKILKDRFGRKETIIFTHIQKLLNLSVPSKCSVSALWKLNDDLQAHTRSLATLGIDGDKYGVILTPLILSRVPQELRLEWSRDGKGHESDLKFLLSFLEKEIQRRERSKMFQESLGPSFKYSVEERRPRVATASALQATSTVKPSKTCCFCGKNHSTEKCFKLSGSIQVKKEKLKSAGLCIRCLLPGHIAKVCSVVCRKCNGRHHEIICGPLAVGPTSAGVSNVSSPPPPSSGNVNASATHSSSTTSFVSVANSTPPGDMSASHPSVALQFARVTVHGSQGVTEAMVMFDTGSDRSFVTQDLVNRVKPKWVDSEPVAFASFGSGKPSKTDLWHIFSVNLQDNHGTDQPLLATAVDVICAPLSRPSLGHDILNSFGDISFADHYETGSVVKIDILIGMDSYWRFVLPQVLCSEVADLIAQNSMFGWIVSGCLSSGSSASHCNVSHQLLCVNVCDDTVRSFWELESVGIVSEDLESAVDPVLQEFENSVDFVDGRYEVKLPWRRGASSGLQITRNWLQFDCRIWIVVSLMSLNYRWSMTV